MLKRLDDPTKGMAVADIIIESPEMGVPDAQGNLPHPDCIRVGVWVLLTEVAEAIGDVRSKFDLPPLFEHKHLLNEIDEIYEQVKEAKRKIGPFAVYIPGRENQREGLEGSGLRGRWKQVAAN